MAVRDECSPVVQANLKIVALQKSVIEGGYVGGHVDGQCVAGDRPGRTIRNLEADCCIGTSCLTGIRHKAQVPGQDVGPGDVLTHGDCRPVGAVEPFECAGGWC